MNEDKIIEVSEKSLAWNGYGSDAIRLVEDIHRVYSEAGSDLPKMLGDFLFSIEVECQEAGLLDEDFNPVNS